jgi:chromosome segregation ATPase
MYSRVTERELYYKYSANPELHWSFKRLSSEDGQSGLWEVRGGFPQPTVEEHRIHLEQIAAHLNDLEAELAQRNADLQEACETIKSLRQDLNNFSTFEQICNSGMLRNFKIDSESPFAQTILSLLQRTMELQISHLHAEQITTNSRDTDETSAENPGIRTEHSTELLGTNETVRPVEGPV